MNQIFIYLNNECNISCITCYSIPNLNNRSIELPKIKELLYYYSALGVTKVTFLGGEPTMYRRLKNVVEISKSLGYSFLRINTNGIYNKNIGKYLCDHFDVICFSVDGSEERINNKIRKNTPWKILNRNIDFAIKNCHDVRMNSTISKLNLPYIQDIIAFADKKGFKKIYLNTVFSKGEAIGHNQILALTPQNWLNALKKINWEDYKIEIKIAQGFSNRSKLNKHLENEHHCGAITGKKIYIDSDGKKYKCLLFIGEDPNVVEKLNLTHSYCQYLKQIQPDSSHTPLCIHYKKKYNTL